MSRLADSPLAIAEGIVARLKVSEELREALGEDDQDGVLARIWDAPPPPDATLPYISLTVPEPRDIGPVGTTILYAEAEAIVKVVGQEEGYEPLAAIFRPIHDALQGALHVPLNGDGMLLTVRRVRSIAYPEQTGGVEYRHLGGVYQVTAQ